MLQLAEIRMRDPFVLEWSAGRFALFGTTDENIWAGPALGFDCYVSDDLESWSGPVPAFRPPAGFWSTTQFWAPEVHAHDGRYFMFATFAGSHGERGTAILVSESPIGPYIPWSDGPVTPRDVPCLDGTLFVDDDRHPWIIYSRGAEGTPGGAPPIADGEMWARRLSSDLRAGIGKPVLLFTATEAPWARPLRFPPGVGPPPGFALAPDPYFTDGAFVVRGGDGALLLLWSSFGEQGYAMGVACSQSGRITGPWVQEQQPLWARDGGHGMVLHTSDGRHRLVFHAPNDSPRERVAMVDIEVGPTSIRLT